MHDLLYRFSPALSIAAGHFCAEPVVCDGNLITSQGPATPYPFALLIAQTPGANTAWRRARTLYPQVGGIG